MLLCQTLPVLSLVISTLSTVTGWCYAPINGMPHLAYLHGADVKLEKEGEFGIGIFPEGVVYT